MEKFRLWVERLEVGFAAFMFLVSMGRSRHRSDLCDFMGLRFGLQGFRVRG